MDAVHLLLSVKIGNFQLDISHTNEVSRSGGFQIFPCDVSVCVVNQRM